VKYLAWLLAFVPLAAWATIYKWTDEDGRVVYANHAPDVSARNVQVLKINDEPAPPAATNRALEERIARLERQLQAPPPPQAAAPYYPAVPPTPAADYYPAPYYSPFGYSYPYAVFPARVVRPVPRFAARRFVSFHHTRSGRR
jgi:Domain of unknown function (DUF4124)